MSARREKRFRQLERRVTALEVNAKATNKEAEYWRRRAFEAEGQKPEHKSLAQRLKAMFSK